MNILTIRANHSMYAFKAYILTLPTMVVQFEYVRNLERVR